MQELILIFIQSVKILKCIIITDSVKKLLTERCQIVSSLNNLSKVTWSNRNT